MKRRCFILMALTVAGCSSGEKKASLPDGYKKIFSTEKADTYIVRVNPWHYRNNKDLIQNDRVIAFKEEDTVIGKKYRSIRTRYVYDCNTENTYAKLPFGFYSDLYATGEPVVPYPFSATRWLVAKDNSLDASLWKGFCKLKDIISHYP